MKALTLRLPVSPSDNDPGGYDLIKSYSDLVKQNMKNLFLTNPGERVMDSLFGVGLRKFLFEPNVEQTHGAIRARAMQQISTYLPYVQLFDIGITPDEDAYKISVRVTYKILPLDVVDALDLLVSSD